MIVPPKFPMSELSCSSRLLIEDLSIMSAVIGSVLMIPPVAAVSEIMSVRIARLECGRALK